MVFVVKSAIKNSDRRNAIRNTWGGVKLYRDVMFEIVFILGNSSDAQAMAKIETENQKYGDILQYNKKDTAEYVMITIHKCNAYCHGKIKRSTVMFAHYPEYISIFCLSIYSIIVS